MCVIKRPGASGRASQVVVAVAVAVAVAVVVVVVEAVVVIAVVVVVVAVVVVVGLSRILEASKPKLRHRPWEGILPGPQLRLQIPEDAECQGPSTVQSFVSFVLIRCSETLNPKPTRKR